MPSLLDAWKQRREEWEGLFPGSDTSSLRFDGVMSPMEASARLRFAKYLPKPDVQAAVETMDFYERVREETEIFPEEPTDVEVAAEHKEPTKKADFDPPDWWTEKMTKAFLAGALPTGGGIDPKRSPDSLLTSSGRSMKHRVQDVWYRVDNSFHKAVEIITGTVLGTTGMALSMLEMPPQEAMEILQNSAWTAPFRAYPSLLTPENPGLDDHPFLQKANQVGTDLFVGAMAGGSLLMNLGLRAGDPEANSATAALFPVIQPEEGSLLDPDVYLDLSLRHAKYVWGKHIKHAEHLQERHGMGVEESWYWSMSPSVAMEVAFGPLTSAKMLALGAGVGIVGTGVVVGLGGKGLGAVGKTTGKTMKIAQRGVRTRFLAGTIHDIGESRVSQMVPKTPKINLNKPITASEKRVREAYKTSAAAPAFRQSEKQKVGDAVKRRAFGFDDTDQKIGEIAQDYTLKAAANDKYADMSVMTAVDRLKQRIQQSFGLGEEPSMAELVIESHVNGGVTSNTRTTLGGYSSGGWDDIEPLPGRPRTQEREAAKMGLDAQKVELEVTSREGSTLNDILRSDNAEKAWRDAGRKFPLTPGKKKSKHVRQLVKELQEWKARVVEDLKKNAPVTDRMRTQGRQMIDKEIGQHVDTFLKDYLRKANVWKKEAADLADEFHSLHKAATKELKPYFERLRKAAQKIDSDPASKTLEGLDEVLSRINMGGKHSFLPKFNPRVLFNAGMGWGEYVAQWAQVRMTQPGVARALVEMRAEQIRRLIPDEDLRQAAHGFMEKTGDWRMLKEGKPDTYIQLVERYKDNPHLPILLEILDQRSKLYEALWDEMKPLFDLVGGELAAKQKGGYLTHAWEPKKPGRRRWRPTKSHMARRTRSAAGEKGKGTMFDTYGKSGGNLEPVHVDIADQIAYTEHQINEMIGIKRIFEDILRHNTTLDNRPIIIGTRGGFPKELDISKYTTLPVNLNSDLAQFLRNKFTTKVPGPGVSTKQHTFYMDRELWNQLSFVLTARTQSKVVKVIDDIHMLAKRMNFGFSLFHALTLTESAIAILGAEGVRASAAQGAGIPIFGEALSKIAGQDTVARRMMGGLEHMAEAEAFAISKGVMVGAPKYDVPIDHVRQIIESWGEKADTLLKDKKYVRGATNKARQKLGEGLMFFQKYYDEALWDKLHHNLKVLAFTSIYNDMMEIKHGVKKLGPKGRWQKRKLQEISDDQIGQEIAVMINDEFGGQNWGLTLSKFQKEGLANPNFLLAMRNTFLSPDWNMSAVRAGTAVLGLLPTEGKLGKAVQYIPGVNYLANKFGGNPVRGMLGMRHWVNATIGIWGSMNIINYLSTKYLYGQGHFMFQNSPGREWTDIQLPWTDEDGGPLYYGGMKQFRDTFGAFYQPDKRPLEKKVPLAFVQFGLSKTQPWLQFVTSPMIRGSGFETELFRQHAQALRENRRLGGGEAVAAYLTDLVTVFSPFSVQTAVRQARKGNPGTALFAMTVPGPISSGPSTWDYRILYREALETENDFQQTKLIYDMYRDGYSQTEIAKIVKQALRAYERGQE